MAKYYNRRPALTQTQDVQQNIAAAIMSPAANQIASQLVSEVSPVELAPIVEQPVEVGDYADLKRKFDELQKDYDDLKKRHKLDKTELRRVKRKLEKIEKNAQ